MKAIIVDDEQFVREDLKEMLLLHKDIEIIGEAETIDAAIVLLEHNEPDLIFLDIQLRGGSSFNLVPHIKPSIQIIFFTAHDEFAVRAFEVNALDFLLKPVISERLTASLDRARSHLQVSGTDSSSQAQFKETDQVFIKTENEQRFIPVKSIIAVTTEGGNYTTLIRNDGNNLLTRRSIKEWENNLPDNTFIKIHRSTIINLKKLKRLVTQKDGKCLVYVSGREEPFEASRREAPKVIEYFEVHNLT